ncbi:MAG: cupredoxin domain-containing protein [Gammaproteobacteria bacterium]|nr:cupredoxin domain-containing protein [Gammaproteobacteria bacterium]
MIDILVNSLGVVLIVLIIYWFWIAKPRTQKTSSDVIDIIVDHGVYEPARIEVEAGKTLTLRFQRKDPSPCAEKVVFSDFDLSVDLAVNKPTDVKLTPDNVGEYPFTCQMQMYRGVLVVKQ